VFIQYCSGYESRFLALSNALLTEFNDSNPAEDGLLPIEIAAESTSASVFEVSVDDVLVHSTLAGQVCSSLP